MSRRLVGRRTGGTVFCLMWTVGVLISAVGPAVAAPSPAAPGGNFSVTPTWDNAPGTDKIQRILNVTAQAGLTCCVLSVLLGGMALGIGRLVGSTQTGFRAGQLIMGGGGGSLIIVFAAKLVNWMIQ